jgi:hypothetical protein
MTEAEEINLREQCDGTMEWLLVLELACATGHLHVEETKARVTSAPLNGPLSLLSTGAILGTHQQSPGSFGAWPERRGGWACAASLLA